MVWPSVAGVIGGLISGGGVRAFGKVVGLEQVRDGRAG